MKFFDSVKRFLGLSDGEYSRNDFEERNERFSDFLQDRNGRFPRNYNNLPVEEEEQMGINIYSNPLEMAKFFEQQMDAVMKSMRSFSGMGTFDDFFFKRFFEPVSPGIEPPENFLENDGNFEQPSGDLRDQYLKPGYRQNPLHESKSDNDLDGRINLDDVDKIFQGNDSKITPYQEKPKFHFYGQSVTSRTIRRPDGTIETHRTVRDQEGNEETTVTRKLGDKEYSLTTKTDKEGHQEIIENLVNMDESEKDLFLKNREPSRNPNTNLSSDDWHIFDRFFR